MSVSSTSTRATYPGNGVASSFTFDFKFHNESELKVVIVDDELVESIPDYTLETEGFDEGGEITLVDGPIPSGYTIIIRREVTLTQETEISNQGGAYLEVIEQSFDRQTMMIQQVNEAAQQALFETAGVPEASAAAIAAALAAQTSAATAIAAAAEAVAAADTVSGDLDVIISAIENHEMRLDDAEDALALLSTAAADIDGLEYVAGIHATAISDLDVRIDQLELEQSVNLTNNQPAPTTIGGLVMPNFHSAMFVDYQITRRTTSTGAVEQMETGSFIVTKLAATSRLTLISTDGDSGVELSVTAAGQVQYTSTNITGTPAVSKINWKVRTLQS